MGIGAGYGKSILFGEHFVVYGLPSLAAGIGSETTAKVTRTTQPGWTIDDKRSEVPGYKEKKTDEQKDSINNVLRYSGVDVKNQGIHIELGGDLICASGIGASAASCVALARAVNDEFKLGLDDVKINEAAFEGEKGYHGTPSGIDNTASTFGGLVWYVRDVTGGPPTFNPIKLDKSVNLVVAATGITASTTEVVGDVRKKKEADPAWFEGIAQEYDALVNNALKALKDYDISSVGKMMDRNHALLQDLTVSCNELDSLVDIARDMGALGAKMTGTGRGGNMIAITPDETSRDSVAKALEKGGASFVIKTSFGK